MATQAYLVEDQTVFNKDTLLKAYLNQPPLFSLTGYSGPANGYSLVTTNDLNSLISKGLSTMGGSNIATNSSTYFPNTTVKIPSLGVNTNSGNVDFEIYSTEALTNVLLMTAFWHSSKQLFLNSFASSGFDLSKNTHKIISIPWMDTTYNISGVVSLIKNYSDSGFVAMLIPGSQIIQASKGWPKDYVEIKKSSD